MILYVRILRTYTVISKSRSSYLICTYVRAKVHARIRIRTYTYTIYNIRTCYIFQNRDHDIEGIYVRRAIYFKIAIMISKVYTYTYIRILSFQNHDHDKRTYVRIVRIRRIDR